jgi:hypothetical protein
MTLEGITRLLIDGNNLLHRTSGSVDAGAQRLLLAKLNGVIPPTIHTVLMLDGHAASGTDRRQRVRRGLEIHHAGSLSADDALLLLIRDIAQADRPQVTLVSDDRTLYEKARHLGARTQRLAWLEALLERPQPESRAVRVGAGKPPAQPAPAEPEREPWKPGRGATRKRGNPRRGQGGGA